MYGIPTEEDIYGQWAALFRVEKFKIWEEKPSLFFTWYNFDMARMFVLSTHMPQPEVMAIAHTLNPHLVGFPGMYCFINERPL